MRRDWHAVYSGMLGKPKYRRLSIPARAGLFHVWLLAGGQSPEATWRDRDELADMLDLDGFPSTVLDELLERHWLDTDDAGRILVHDWDQHQLAATEAARVAYERDRKADWRRRSKTRDPLSPAPLTPDKTSHAQAHHITEVPESPGSVRDIDWTSWCETCSRPTRLHRRDCPKRESA